VKPRRPGRGADDDGEEGMFVPTSCRGTARTAYRRGRDDRFHRARGRGLVRLARGERRGTGADAAVVPRVVRRTAWCGMVEPCGGG
jgi:hypothetical protein